MPVKELIKNQAYRNAARWCGFAVALVGVWGGYFCWRPPAPILWLHHVEHLKSDSGSVALTFDDAPHPLTTPLLLASLRRTGVKATFFVIGDGLRLYPELARRILADGHAMGNHSENHHNLTRVTPDKYDREVEDCFVALRGLGDDTHLFRPPGGGLDRSVMNYLYAHDVTLAWWSNNVGDWQQPPAWKIVNGVLGNLQPGDILLLHDAGTGTPQALPRLVREIRERGLKFVPMPDR